jgi:peptidoglycan/LPS O-acetylase OafA/YrhL
VSAPSSKPIKRGENYPALNGLRFLAAMFVVVFHCAYKLENYERAPALVHKLVADGPAAVGFFFILSGFLLATRHVRRSGLPTESAAEFYWARFIRLYPAYLVGFFLFLPFAIEKYLRHPTSGDAEAGIFGAAAILYFLMLQAWTPLAQAWNGPSWSLSVEAFMYFIFPGVVGRLTRMNSVGTVLLSCMAWLTPSVLTVFFLNDAISEHTWRTYIGNNPLFWTPLFLIGICLAKFLPVWNDVADRNANLIGTGAFVMVILIATLAPASCTELLINGGMAPLLALVVISFTRSNGWLTRTIGGKVMNRLGQASYVIYIIQSPLWAYWQALTNHLRHFPIRVAVITPWQFIFFMPFITLLSIGVQNYIETPLYNFLASWKNARSRRLALSAAAQAERIGA